MYQPSRVHHVETGRSIVLGYFILHNMIVEEQKDVYIGLQGMFKHETALSSILEKIIENPFPKASNMTDC